MAMTFNKIGDGEWKLNVCGYTCPHPQMYTKKALQKMEGGDVLILEFDNPSSGESILAMCEAEGNDLFDKQDLGGSFSWKIRKA
ncbi:MAG: sulfurtransferase TusA family protein [Gammaproteobacteria bacterium]|nr:sulfurtransferase TusA family protein [Gammaproteobacteria bacterium]MBU1776923.1 sulfurtransferase TusA family protein [Gammaproteobacteria bacterium]MBU1968602.1 sulfurtransferase TusA family protein [Gammaproteobacteria bacterium]